MPSRSQTIIRRDINRLSQLAQRAKVEHVVFGAIAPTIAGKASQVNSAWQAYQTAAIAGDKERGERDTVLSRILSWIQRWRPVVFMLIPGARPNVHTLPSGAATPDDVVRVAEDLRLQIVTNPAAQPFRAEALAEIGGLLETVNKEIEDASKALPVEAATRDAYGSACLEANEVLILGLQTVRAVFGPTSPEYKQFIGRDTSAAEEDEAEGTQPAAGK